MRIIILIFIFISLGIVFEYYNKTNFLFLYTLGIIGLVYFIFSKNKTISLFLICALSFIIGTLFFKRQNNYPPFHIVNHITYQDKYISLIGSIKNKPSFRNNKISFIFEVEKIKKYERWYIAKGKILLNLFLNESHKLSLNTYQRLYICGRIYYGNIFKYYPKYNNYLRSQALEIYLNLKPERIKIIEQLTEPFLEKILTAIREKIKNRFINLFTRKTSCFLEAILLGERKGLDSQLINILSKLGTGHILAISGLHIGIIVFTLWLFLKILRIPLKIRVFVITASLLFYSFLVKLKPSVLRASIMSICFLFSFLVKRKSNPYNQLALAGLIIIFINPWYLFEIGFQLSFLSVFFILWFSPIIKMIFKKIKISWLKRIFFLLSYSFSVWLGVFPLIAYYFRIISPLSMIINLLVIPMITLIVAGGFVVTFLSFINFFLAKYFASAIDLLVYFLVETNLFFNKPGIAYFRINYFSFPVLFYYYIVIFILRNFGLIKKIILTHKDKNL